MGRHEGEFFPAVFDPPGRPFLLRENFPGGVKASFPAGHRPRGVAFVQKSFAPLGHFSVDLLDNLRAENAIAPGGQQSRLCRAPALLRHRAKPAAALTPVQDDPPAPQVRDRDGAQA